MLLYTKQICSVSSEYVFSKLELLSKICIVVVLYKGKHRYYVIIVSIILYYIYLFYFIFHLPFPSAMTCQLEQ